MTHFFSFGLVVGLMSNYKQNSLLLNNTYVLKIFILK